MKKIQLNAKCPSLEARISSALKSENEKVLADLAGDRNCEVRRCVAENLHTSKETLEKLSVDRDLFVRELVARNVNASQETLDYLSEDESEFVRIIVAENLMTPDKALIRLSKDEQANIREAVANNPFTPLRTLYELEKEDSYLISFSARLTRDCLVDMRIKAFKRLMKKIPLDFDKLNEFMSKEIVEFFEEYKDLILKD